MAFVIKRSLVYLILLTVVFIGIMSVLPEPDSKTSNMKGGVPGFPDMGEGVGVVKNSWSTGVNLLDKLVEEYQQARKKYEKNDKGNQHNLENNHYSEENQEHMENNHKTIEENPQNDEENEENKGYEYENNEDNGDNWGNNDIEENHRNDKEENRKMNEGNPQNISNHQNNGKNVQYKETYHRDKEKIRHEKRGEVHSNIPSWNDKKVNARKPDYESILKTVNRTKGQTRVYTSPADFLLRELFKEEKFYKELFSEKVSDKLPEHVVVDFTANINQTLYQKYQKELPFERPDSVSKISCKRLFENDISYKKQIHKSLAHKAKDVFYKNGDILEKTKNCDSYIKTRGYIMNHLSEDEKEFPLAYSVLMYKDLGQVEHLLRAIYRPQNHYCIHVDKKTDTETKTALKSLTNCFSNVFILSKSVDIKWGTSSILEADISCMTELLNKVKHKKKWKYFINLTGQEFPLKTNWEIVQILKAYNGASEVGATVSPRWHFRWKCILDHINATEFTCKRRNSPPPHKYTMAKGPTHIAITFQFADFILKNPVAHDLYKWLYPTNCPEEIFFNTLFLSPKLKVPSAYTGPPNTDLGGTGTVARYKKWGNSKTCKGKAQRHICVVSIWDLPDIKMRPEFFVNKLESTYHPLAYHCLEEWHHTKTLEEITAHAQGLNLHFDTREYQKLPWVRHHL